MMARASRSIPTYTPSLYLPGSFGRYRQYPRVVRTSIPGAGVEAGKMVWGEQVMNLWGAPVAKYSNARVPLLGIGQVPSSAPTLVAGQVAGSLPGLMIGLLVGDIAGGHGDPVAAYRSAAWTAVGSSFLAGALAMHLAHKYHWLGMR